MCDKLCVLCLNPVEPERAVHKQTKRCLRCARLVKKRQTRDSRPPEDRREYMRLKQAEFRFNHPGYNNPYVRRHRERKRAARRRAA